MNSREIYSVDNAAGVISVVAIVGDGVVVRVSSEGVSVADVVVVETDVVNVDEEGLVVVVVLRVGEEAGDCVPEVEVTDVVVENK